MKLLIPAPYLPWFVLAIVVMSVVLILLHNSRWSAILYSEFRFLNILKRAFPMFFGSDSPRVLFSNTGRGGYVFYESREGSFQMYWEFAGGDALASIEIPSVEDWKKKTGIPLEQRDAVLDFIGRQTVAQQTTGGKGSFKIEGDWLVIYS